MGRSGVELPDVCNHLQLGPIQTCDTCLVDVDDDLVRACATLVSQESVRTTTARAQSARLEAFDRILTNHLLYCTVCNNNNGNCTVHNTTKMLGVGGHSGSAPPRRDPRRTLSRSDGLLLKRTD